MKTYVKGLLMAVVAFVAATITDLETFNAAYVGVTTVAFVIIYLGKNAWLPSVSESMTVDMQDLISGLLIAAGMAISSFAASVLTTGAVDWKALLVAVVSSVVGYFGKTFATKGK